MNLGPTLAECLKNEKTSMCLASERCILYAFQLIKEIGVFSAALFDYYGGLVIPLFNIFLGGIGFNLHGRPIENHIMGLHHQLLKLNLEKIHLWISLSRFLLSIELEVEFISGWGE